MKYTELLSDFLLEQGRHLIFILTGHSKKFCIELFHIYAFDLYQYNLFHRKVELFGRPHNVQPNWVTLGNQLDGIVIHDDEMLKRWNKVYPDGYNITEDIFLQARLKP